MAQRRVFTKLLKDEKAVMRDLHQARRFLEGMETFNSKPDLLTQLTDNRYYGLRRIGQLMAFCYSLPNVETCLVGLLKHILTEETGRPMYRRDRNKILMVIFIAPRLIESLVELDAARALRRESADYLNKYLLHASKAFVEARQSEGVKELAKALRERGDVDNATMLCALLLVDASVDKEENLTGSLPGKKKAVACWVTDETPPGGRHDNDHLNYRDVQVVPTANELCCETLSWLPLSTGDNAYIADRQIRLLDGQFRLLREDAIRIMKANTADDHGSWKNARVIDLQIEGPRKRADVSFLVQCDSRENGNPNWERSRALSHGAVVAFCREGIANMLGVITNRDAEKPGKWLNAPGGPVIGVRFEETSFQQALDDMNLNCVNGDSVSKLEAQLRDTAEDGKSGSRPEGLKDRIQQFKDQMSTYTMVEASSSFFSYQPVLKALQSMSSLPFSEELCGEPSERESSLAPDYLPPELRMILPLAAAGDDPDEFQNIRLESWSSEDIVGKTTLDLTQADALHHAFTNRVALIQGPPGTGKTFIGALLARTIRHNTDESILCICYTNHALDQFLEHLLDAGEKRIVRIGGRSRSEKLEPYQLRELSRNKASSLQEDARRIKRVDAQLYEQQREIDKTLEAVKKPLGWKQPNGGVKSLLQDYHPDFHQCLLLPVLSEGFRIVGSDNKALKDDYLWTCWVEGQAFPDFLRSYLPDADDLPDCFAEFWGCPAAERLAMREGWRREILGDKIESLQKLIDQFNDLIAERQAIRQEKDLQILKEARVIGVTTTGAAQYKDLLNMKGPGVVIIEEAGEVLEAHILSALADTTKHLVLIGDHQQLRPKVESYELTTVSGGGYNLDCSLFERLVMSKLCSITLGTQHRMRPEISEFIRQQTYPNLQDHPSVHDFPDVKGVSENLAFIDHSFPEDGAGKGDDTRSMKTKSNYAEAELCIEVVRFLLLQGYSADRIVILTPYLGQLFKIIQLVRQRLKEATAYVSENDLADLERMNEDAIDNTDQQPRKQVSKSVRCSSIDNFQGEEAEIIVLSLVRSNSSGNIGFLKEEQRVNVLMSRARHGMFLIGNASTLRLSKGRHVWDPILKGFEQSNRFLRGLPTVCQLHANDGMLLLTTVNDFRTLRPNGGCTRPCNFRMECGHACPLMCHPYDRQHQVVQGDCCEPCRRVPPDCHMAHQCTKRCKDECGPCQVIIENVQLNCGHIRARATCHDIRNDNAKVLLTKTCHQVVKHTFSNCGHELETTCSNSRSEKPKCPGKCAGTVEGCGHPCIRECGECAENDQQHNCGMKCERKLFCGHICAQPCHVGRDCPPCSKPCFRSCPHSECPKKCNLPCASCVEDCDWVCEHEGKCALVCGAPCSRLPCNQRCSKKLKCGHQCPSLCGEPCPEQTYCQECCNDKLKSITVDMICFTTYKDHNVEEDPVIVLPCGHFYATSTLDGHLSIDLVYKKQNGDFVAVKPLSDAVDITEKPRVCPDCRSMVHSVRRYGRILHFSEVRSLERKHIMSNERVLNHLSTASEKSNKNSKDLVSRLRELERNLLKSPMTRVYEACIGRNAFDVPRPQSKLLLETLGLLAKEYSNLSNKKDDDDNFIKARETLVRAIEMADESLSTRSGAILRIQLCNLLVKYEPTAISDPVKKEVLVILETVIELDEKFPDLASEARGMKESILSRKVIAEVLRAATDGGYNYGTSWSSHWYECPNGHPFYIGNCGQAMQQSRCIECNAVVGGSSHTLDPTNRTVGGLVREVLENDSQG